MFSYAEAMELDPNTIHINLTFADRRLEDAANAIVWRVKREDRNPTIEEREQYGKIRNRRHELRRTT